MFVGVPVVMSAGVDVNVSEVVGTDVTPVVDVAGTFKVLTVRMGDPGCDTSSICSFAHVQCAS